MINYRRKKMIKKLFFISIFVFTLSSIGSYCFAVGYGGERVLFDIVLTISNRTKKIRAGEKIVVDVKLTNFGIGITENTKVPVKIDYSVDSDKSNILKESEDRSVAGREESFQKEFLIPVDTELGQYTLFAKMTYNQKDVASSSDIFEIVGKTSFFYSWPFWTIVVGVSMLVIAISIIPPLMKKPEIK